MILIQGGVPLDSVNDESSDEPRRSARLQKPRRSPRINKTSWINDDLEDLKFLSYNDDRVYEYDGKNYIVPIEDSVDKVEKQINNTTLSTNKKKDVKSKPKATNFDKIKAVVGTILGSMVQPFESRTTNYHIPPVGNTNEINGYIPYSHIIEEDINIIDDNLNVNASTDLLSYANLAVKRELQFMDIVDDEKDKDYSFVPIKITDHHISRQPRHQFH